MKRFLFSLAAIVASFMMAFSLPAMTFAEGEAAATESGSDCVQTSIFGSGGQYCNGVWGIVGIVLNVLLVVVGAAGIIGIIISGIQYATSSGDPGQITKAKKRIYEIVIGLVALGLMYAFLQWLIPGGVI